MKLIIAALAVLAMTPVLATNSAPKAEDKVLCKGFMPENRMAIPDDFADASTGITHDQFNAVAARINQMYAGEVASHGAQLKIMPMWSNATVNSNASEQGSTWIIRMFGGLARFHGMTPDAEAYVACHEMGHHLGGAPKFQGPNGAPI
jgi:hypothetical protein